MTLDMNKQTWTNIYRTARILNRCRNLPEDRYDGDTKVVLTATAYYAVGRYHRSLARRIAETRWDRQTLPIRIMKHVLKHAQAMGADPFEVYWDLHQPMRFDPRRLP